MVQFLNRQEESERCVLCLMPQCRHVLHFVVREDFVFILRIVEFSQFSSTFENFGSFHVGVVVIGFDQSFYHHHAHT